MLKVAVLALMVLMQSPVDLLNRATSDIAEAIRQMKNATVVTVAEGANLQAVIDANPGRVIALKGTFVGPIYLKGAVGGTLTTVGFVSSSDRITPLTAVGLAKIKAPGQLQSAIIIEGCNWNIKGIEAYGEANDLVNVAKSACNTVIDQSYIHGDVATGAKRGVAANGQFATITNSWISDIKRVGQDSQAIAGWDGPGPYVIRNNYLEAAGENIIFGGSDPSTPGLIPGDITIDKNTLTKNPNWRTQSWTVKNLLELKNARRVSVTDNVLSGSWTNGQTGFAFMLTVRNQDGGCPWCVVEDVTIARNTITNVGALVNVLGKDDNYPSGVMKRVVFRDNTATICTTEYPGAARVFQITGGPQGLAITGNKIGICANSWLSLLMTFEGIVTDLVVTDNVMPEGAYGIHSPDAALGKATLALHAPGYVWLRNTILRTVLDNNIPYPEGTTIR